MAQLIEDLPLSSSKVIWTPLLSRYSLSSYFYTECLKKNLLNRSLALFGRYYQNVDWADPENTPDDNVMSDEDDDDYDAEDDDHLLNEIKTDDDHPKNEGKTGIVKHRCFVRYIRFRSQT